MAQPPTPSTLGSNNPFRRKTAPTPPTAPGSVASASPAPQQPPTFHETDTDPSAARVVLPSGDEFWNQLQGDLSRPSQPPPTTSFQKPKVVKRVRVQSPAPSSPESAGGPRRVIESESDDDSDSDSDSESVDSAERLDPFTGAPSLDSVRETGTREDIVIPVSTFGTPPPNPFQTTGKDLRGTAQIPDPPGSGGTRGGLDVGAFGRLLLTGQTGGAAVSSQHIAHQMVMGGLDGGSNTATDASSISRQSSILDQPRISQDHTPRTSHEISEQEPEDENRGLISKASTLQPAPTILRKKPPPPSSRHGKLIKQEPSQPAQPARSLSSPTPRDINKPLPFSPEVEETTNIFDHSAAGKVPEPRPPTPPQPSRKPLPPAPRRQSHKQQTSVGSALTPAATPNSDDIDPLTRRSSVDSVRSRSSSLRVSVHAPPPAPPPRRPGGHGRGASSSTLSSPPPPVSALSPASDAFGESPLGISGLVVSTPPQISGSGTPDGTAGAGASGGSVNMHHLHSKLSPPPPPPARNSSVRTGGGSKRPVSLSERKGSAGGIGGLKSPPPPVPRHRGEGLRAGSTGSVGSLEQKVGEVGSSGDIVGDAGQSVDILADLTRLQREVDALRAGLAIAGAGQEGTEGIPGKRNGTI